MRLICPNCDAQYEVPDNVIPDAGRDVQCSDCGNTWFQSSAEAEADSSFERQPIPPEVSEILQEEAEIERRARAQDFDEQSLDDTSFEDEPDDIEPVEVQSEDPDADAPEAFEEISADNPFAFDPEPEEPEENDAERRARETRERMARMRGIEANNPFVEAKDSRKAVLPDVDAINSSLSPEPDAARAKSSIDLEYLHKKKRRGSGFRTGFAVMVFLGLFAIAFYTAREGLGRALPFTAPALDAYAAAVDQWRLWVEAESANLIARLDSLVSNLLNG